LNFLANEVNCIFVAKVQNMGTLSGQRVKDAYTSLLKLESGTATSTTKVIEDGAGNDTALKLSTTKVEVNGTLGFSEAPTTGSTEVAALFLDASNNLVKRNLGTAAFTSGASLTPVAPLAIVSNVISISAPTTLAQLTSGTLATADTFMVYDATATVYKYVTLSDLTTYVGNNISVAAAGSNGQVTYNNGGVAGGSSSLVFNDSPGAEQLNFMGLDFVQREASSGTCAFFSRSDSATINNAVTNGVVTTIEADLFAGGWIIDYMIYNSGSTIVRVGEIHVAWNPDNLATSPVMVDSIKTSIGSSTTSTFVFNATILSTTLQLRASNTTGSNMTVLVNGKAFYAF
jgi:hypothetical protein